MFVLFLFCFGRGDTVFREMYASDEMVGSGLQPATSEEKIHKQLIMKQKQSKTEKRNGLIRLFNR